MKKIILTVLLSMFLGVFATSQPLVEKKDTVQKESMRLDISVKSDPTSITINSEALEKNEALQQTLETVNVQTIVMSDKLSDLNQTLSQKQKVSDNLQMVENLDLTIEEIAYNKRAKQAMLYLLLLITSLFVYIMNADTVRGIYKNQNHTLAIRGIIRIICLFIAVVCLTKFVYFLSPIGRELELYNTLIELM